MPWWTEDYFTLTFDEISRNCKSVAEGSGVCMHHHRLASCRCEKGNCPIARDAYNQRLSTGGNANETA